jgi:hypothetical protein
VWYAESDANIGAVLKGFTIGSSVETVPNIIAINSIMTSIFNKNLDEYTK